MNRYLIAYLLTGEALTYHTNLVKDVTTRFKVSPQKICGHLTLKAPFELENASDIKHIEKVIGTFTKSHIKTPITFKNFSHFRDNVVDMDVIPSAETNILCTKLKQSLLTLECLEWKSSEINSPLHLHATIVSRRISPKFQDIWEYVNTFNYEFNEHIDNITIMKWSNNRWEVYKQYFLN